MKNRKILINSCLFVVLLCALFFVTPKLMLMFYGNSEGKDKFCNDIVSVFNLCEQYSMLECVSEIDNLIENKYPNETPLYLMLASLNYNNDNKLESAVYLEKALAGDYTCDSLRPTEYAMFIEKSIIHNNLSKVYMEIGDSERSISEKEIASKLLKLGAGDKYSSEYENRIMSLNIFKMFDTEK